MSILYLARNRKRIQKTLGIVFAISIMFMMLIAPWGPGTALAGSVGDVVTQVSNANTGSPEFKFGQESATGYGFAIHAGMGDYGDGGCMLSVLGPAQPDEIKIMIDYVDGISQVTYIRTTQMKGCEVREYNTDDGVGIGVVLPDYFITVEMLDTGLNQDANMAAAKSIAQQTLDGLEQAGLLSQAAPDIESGKTDKKQPAKSKPATPAVVTGNPLDEPVKVSDTMNIAVVQNGPTVPTTFSINGPHLVTYILNYHWNSAQGATPGTIALQDSNGKTYGPWQATGTPGQGGVPNANWEVSPNIVIPAGTYTVVDSDPATWSTNADSGGKGMGEVKVTPHFEVTSGSVDDLNKGTPGSSPGGSGWAESPAGVGSVGNIPGPSNTTEAVIGVAVPGLIATGLGALAGFGGGGGPVSPGGTPLYPTGGGPSPVTGGSYPGTGNARPGAVQEVSQLGGRRRGEEIYVDTGAIGQKAIDIREVEQPADHGMIIDTADMFETPIAVQPKSEIIIDTAAEGLDVIVKPESGIIIDTDAIGTDVIGPESGMIIDTADEAAIFVQPEPEIHIDTVDMHEQAIDIREPGGETGIHIDTTDMFEESPVLGASDEKGIFIEMEDEAALFVKSGSDLEVEAEQMKPQAFSAREGEAGGAHFATAENSEGAPAAAQSEHLYTDAGDSEVPLNTSSLEDSAGAETVPGSEEAATAGEAEGQSAEQTTAADADSTYDQNGFDPEGYNREGFDKEGFDQAGFDKDGFDKAGFNAEGYNKDGFNPEGLNKEGFDRQGFDKEGFDREGFDKAGFDKDGFNQEGYNSEGYDKAGYDREGYDREGMNQADFDRDGYNSQGFDKDGFNREGFDKEGFNKAGFDKEGFNREGFDKSGFDREGFDKAGFNAEGFDKEGFNKAGFDKEGFNKAGFDQDGFNREGFDKSGFDREGFDKAGFNAEGFDKEGFNKAGFDQEGFNREGFDKSGFDREGFDKAGFNAEGFDKEGFNKAGFDKEGFNREGFDKTGFDKEGFNKEGFDKSGFDREGFDKAGFNAEGFDREGFNKAGFDKEGYGRNGFDSEGFDREGYDVNGYDRKGFNRSGFDAKGYDKQGYDKEGFNKDGWDREGYNRKGFDENGWDREGYDKNGYDAEGYDRDGYNREGQSKEGYDADGYDKKGFNEHGYDRDGYDREGFDFEGYNRSGYDPWGYDKQGFGKDGYHWSGYNADGYNREGMHWTDNPYEEGSIWNVDTYNPFDGRAVDLGGRREAWEPTKPPLGEPYHQTVEKYGAKPWTDEVPQPTSEKPTIPSTEDAGVIGPEDPMNTLKNHGIDQDAPTAPEGQTGTGLPIPEEDIPDAGNIPPVSGPQHGDTITLPGKDGRDYQLEYNSQTGEWENLLTGGRIRNEDLGSYVEDFNRWQDDVAEDLSRSARDIEKMAARQDATSQAIDKNLADWKRLEQMQKAADKYNIGEPGGPGDVDKAIQNLKDDMLAGKEVDQDRLEQLNKIIDNRIQGTTAADTGQRWEEDWFKNLGWALEANAATAKEVVTGEKADGSTSWLGMGARIMITTATGGTAGVVMDGGLTVAEAMYRIKDSIDKGESDFRAVSKAIGLTVLGEEAGWLVGAAGSKVMGEMMERFPAFTNKAADLIETAILKGSAKNQMWSKSLGLISKESAEETLDQINKRLVDIGSGEAAENIIKKARTDYGLKSVSDSFDDVSKAGKAFTGSGDDILKGGKSASEGWSDIAEGGGRTVSSSSDDVAKGAGKVASSSSDDVAKGAGKAASSSDDIAKGGGKAASGSGDDIAKGSRKTVSDSGDDLAKGGGKAASDSSDDMAKGAGTGNRPKATDGADVEPKSSAAGGDGPDGPVRTGDGGGDGPGDPGGPPRGGGGDAGSAHSEAINNRTLNTNARTPEEVLSDPASVARAEQSLQKNIKDFDKLPPTRQQDLIREQAIYDEYKMQAQERTYNVADKIERREPLTVEDIMEMKADPASMRTLKDLENVDGIGAELGPIRSRQVQSEFNHVLDTEIHRPSYRNVEDHLRTRYPQNGPGEIRCRTVRTPGTEPRPWNINTDNDVIAERLVHGPNGPEWVEIPKAEWEDTYYKAFAENSGFSVDEATRRFPDSDWAKMDDATRFREWAGRHEESAMDQFDLEAARDFSDQRTWRINDGDLPGRPMIEATPEEIARGVDIVMIDGRPMRPSTAYELVQRRQGNLLDSEQLSMMESYKVDEYWNAGSTPSEVMRNQTEAMEQLRKTASVAQTVESSYRDMGYRIEQMPNNMQEAIKVINNNNLSPAARAARLQELGYETPGDFLNKVTSRIGAIREARI